MDRADEILNQAAIAAKALLPELEKERQTLVARTIELNKKIEGLVAIIKNGSDVSMSGAASAQASANLSSLEVSGDTRRAPRGLIESQMDETLRTKGPLSVNELENAMEVEFKVRYSRSSFYNNLKRGEDSGKYRHLNGKWSFIKQNEEYSM